MKVLYFDPKFATPRRYAPTRAFSFAKHFVGRGHEVTLIGRDSRYMEVGRDGPPDRRPVVRLRIEGVEAILLKIPYSMSFSKWQRLLSYGSFMAAAIGVGAALPRPDVVYASSTPLTVGVCGLATARLKRVPFVFEIQDLWPAVPIELGFLRRRTEIRVAQWLERTLYAGAACVVVCSEGSREALLRQGVPDEKILLVPNVSDLELFQPGLADDGLRRRLGLEGKFLALYTGAMGKANGVHQLVDAALALREAGEDRIAIVALGFGSERPSLERRVRELGLDNLVVPEPVAREEIAGIVGDADATLTVFAPYPVLETNSPNKFFDSLAAGKPVVVNLDGWLRGLVEEHDAGVYVPGGDGKALADALVRLADDPERAREMGRNARALAEKEFDRDLLADRVAATLEELAGAAAA